MAEVSEVIPAGPGCVDYGSREYGRHGLSADVGLELEYVNAAPSDTRAVLHLRATEIEGSFGDVAIGIELTKLDMVRLIDTLISMVDAADEDDSDVLTQDEADAVGVDGRDGHGTYREGDLTGQQRDRLAAFRKGDL